MVASDGKGGLLLTGVVGPVPSAPIASNGAIVVGHNQSVDETASIESLITPGGPGDYPFIASVSGSSKVALKNGEVIYTSGASGKDQFSYSVIDQYGAQASGTVSVTVDSGPVAQNGSIQVAANGAYDETVYIDSLVAPGLAGDQLTIVSATGNATVTNGRLIYTAPATISDQFQYTVEDQYGDLATGTVTVASNPGPKTSSGSILVGHNKTTDITAAIEKLISPGLVGDTDTIVAVSGAAALANGVVTYRSGAAGSDSFTYTVRNQNGQTSTGTVQVRIDGGPAAASGAIVVGHGQTADITASIKGLVTPGVAGDSETITAIAATNGAATLTSGNVEYTAPSSGSDNVGYTVTDQLGQSAGATVSVTVDPGPTANSGVLALGAGHSADITAFLKSLVTPGLNGDTETITAVSAAHGQASVVNGEVVYVAPGSGSDTLSYTVRDQYGDSATGQVTQTAIQPLPQRNVGTLDVESGLSYVSAAGVDFANDGELLIDNISHSEGSAVNVGGSLTNGGAIDIADNLNGAGLGGSTLSVAGTLTNTGSLRVGGAGLVAPVTITAGALIDSGAITLDGNGLAGHGVTMTVGSNVGPTLNTSIVLDGGASLQFAGGGFTSIASGGELMLNGQNSEIDIAGQGAESAVAGVTSNAGGLHLQNGMSYYGSGASVPASNGAQLALTANSGTFDLENRTSYATGANFTNNGDLRIDVNSQSQGSSLMVGGNLSNTGSINIADDLRASGFGGSTLSVAGTLTNSGHLTAGVGVSGALAAPVTIAVGGLVDTGSIALDGADLAGHGVTMTVGSDAWTNLGTSISLIGGAKLQFAGGDFTSISSSGALTLGGANAEIDGGSTVNGVINNALAANAGTFDIESGFAFTTAQSFATSGELKIDDGYGAHVSLDMSKGSSLSIAGDLVNTGAIDIARNGNYVGTTVTVAGKFDNKGALNVGAGSQALGTSAPVKITVAQLDDTGTINLDGDGLPGHGVVMSAGSYAPSTLIGSILLSGGAELVFGGGSITTIAKTADLSLTGAHTEIDSGSTVDGALGGVTFNQGGLHLLTGDAFYSNGKISAANNGEALNLTASSGTFELGDATSFTTDQTLVNSGDLQLDFESGSIDSLLSIGGDLVNSGAIDIADQAKTGGFGGSTIAVAGTLANSGSLQVGGGWHSGGIVAPVTITAGALTDTGSIYLDGNNLLGHGVTMTVGSNAWTTLNTSITLRGGAAMKFAGGGFTTIGVGGSLTLGGADVEIDSGATKGGAIDNVLAENLGIFDLEDHAAFRTNGSFTNDDAMFLDYGWGGLSDFHSSQGSSLTIGGNFTNNGSIDIADQGLVPASCGGTAISVGGTFTNQGSVQVGGGYNSGLGAPVTITVDAMVNTGTINLYANNLAGHGVTFNVLGAATGAGSIFFNGGALISFGANSTQNVVFNGPNAGELRLGANYTGVISDLDLNDKIDLTSVTYNAGEHLVWSAEGGGRFLASLEDSGNNVLTTLNFGTFEQYTALAISADANGQVLLTDVVSSNEPGPIVQNSSIEAPANQDSTLISGANPKYLPVLKDYENSSLTDYIAGLISASFPGETWAITAVSGAASLNNGVVSYHAGASGQDSFTYTATDQYGVSSTGTISVAIDGGPTSELHQLSIVNDSSINLSNLIPTLVTSGLAGDGEKITSVTAQNGVITPVPVPGGVIYYYTAPVSTGPDTISYTVANQFGQTTSNQIDVNVTPTPDLVVTNIVTPSNAFSGETTQISWTVKNVGGGSTAAGSWVDKVFLSYTPNLDWFLGNRNAPEPIVNRDTHVGNNDVLLATVQNPAYLNAGDSYTNTATITLPNNIGGPYYIIVVPNANNLLGAGDYTVLNATDTQDLYTASSVFPVTLLPPAALTVTNVITQPKGFTGQSFNLTWTVTNAGAGATNVSDWTDEVYVSANSTFDSTAVSLGTFDVNSKTSSNKQAGDLASGASYTMTAKVILPQTLTGELYFYVVTDSGNQVYRGANPGVSWGSTQTEVDSAPPLIDLVATSLTTPTTLATGQTFQISYDLTNESYNASDKSGGDVTFVCNYYLSASPILTNSAILLKNFADSMPHNLADLSPANFTDLPNNLEIPEGVAAGNYYLILQTGVMAPTANGGTVFVPTGTKVSGAIAVADTTPSLQAQNINVSSMLLGGHQATLSWQDANIGAGGVPQGATWNDEIVLSRSGVLGAADNIVIGNLSEGSAKGVNANTATPPSAFQIAAGAALSESANINIPAALNGNYTLFVVPDSQNQLAQEATRAQGVRVTINSQAANLAVGNILILDRSTQPAASSDDTGAPTATGVSAGDKIKLTWTVANYGTSGTNAAYWFDNVYLSSTSTLSDNALQLGQIERVNSLAAGNSYTASATFTLPPYLSAGTYYFIVEADGDNQVAMVDRSATVLASSATAIAIDTQPVTATDLTASNVVAPTTVYSNQSFTLSWTVANNSGANQNGGFDLVYLSKTPTLDVSNAIYLGSVTQTALTNGTTQNLSHDFNIPAGLSGNYYVIVAPDDETNSPSNLGVSAQISVSLPPQGDGPLPDLTVANVSGPTSVVAGAGLNISYSVANLNPTDAKGNWSDAVYLSATPQWSDSAILLGAVQHQGGLNGGSSYAGTLDVAAPGVTPGNYYVIVRANVRNNVPESSQGNNAGVSGVVSVTVPTLTLGTPVSGALTSGQTQYYQFNAIAGQTIEVALASSVANSINNAYVRYGSAPTFAQFDATSRSQTSADPNFTFQATQTGTYYVEIVANSIADGGSSGSLGRNENYTLSVNSLPYSITHITPDAGSNLGSVTMTIDGAQMAANEQVEIVDAATGATVVANHVQWVNGAEMFATFDLRGAAVGSYNVVIQSGSQTAELDTSFHVTNGPAGELKVSLTAPSVVRQGNTGVIQVNYQNDGQTDINAPLLALTSDGTLLSEINASGAATQSGLGTSSVVFMATSQNGPAGVLAPGQSGVATYVFTPTATTVPSTFSFTVNGFDGTTIDSSALTSVTGGGLLYNLFGITSQQIQPGSIDNADWGNVWNVVTSKLGGSVKNLESTLAAAETALGLSGVAIKQDQGNIGLALNYEILMAEGAESALVTGPLASATDIAASGPLGPSLSRVYSGSLTNRDLTGLFGDGWTSAYDAHVNVDAQGDIWVVSASGSETFYKLPDGTYQNGQNDGAALTFMAGGGYRIAYRSGEVATYLVNGKLSSLTDANGNNETLNWSAAGALQSVTSSDGEQISFVTNVRGCIISATASNGQTATYSYDSTGTQLLSVSAAGGVTSYSYNAPDYVNAALPDMASINANALLSVTNPDGTQRNFAYNSDGSLASRSGANGAGKLSYGYATPGQMTVTDANGATTTYGFTEAGATFPTLQIGSVKSASGDVTRYSYNAAGQLAQVAAANGSTYSFNYDSSGNLASYTDGRGNVVAASYVSGTNRLSALSDQLGDKTLFNYDAKGNLIGETYQNASGASATYNSQGLRTSSTDASGAATTYAYDNLSRLTKETFADGKSQSYAYNAAGDLISATALDGGITAYTYNSANELTSVTDANGRTISYTYNSGGQLIQKTDPDGSVTNYTYNSAGLLADMTDGSGKTIESYIYNSANQLVEKDMGNGGRTTYKYTPNGQVQELRTLDASGAVVSDYSYSYNSAGLVVGASQLDGAWAYGYDANGELTSATFTSNVSPSKDQSFTYKYDAAGNRSLATINGQSVAYTTNGMNQYVTAGGTTYAYNAKGDLISQTDASGNVTTYAYNEANELTSITSPTGTTTYTYDALGNVIATNANGMQTQNLIDPIALYSNSTGPLAALSQVYDASGNVTATYNYGVGGLSSTTNGTGTLYYLTDANKNVVGLAGINGNLTASYEYSPYGTLISSMGSIANPFQFAGGIGETTGAGGLVSMRARYYDPATGRFTTEDQTGVNGGINLYGYVGNNPIQFVDLTGHFETNSNGNGTRADGYNDSFGGWNLNGVLDGVNKWRDGITPPTKSDWIKFGIGAAVILPVLFPEVTIAVLTSELTLAAFIAAVEYLQGVANGGYQNDFEPVFKVPEYLDLAKKLWGKLVAALDPNDIYGPTGFGPNKVISPAAPLTYQIDFQNASTATAPAQHVEVARIPPARAVWH